MSSAVSALKLKHSNEAPLTLAPVIRLVHTFIFPAAYHYLQFQKHHLYEPIDGVFDLTAFDHGKQTQTQTQDGKTDSTTAATATDSAEKDKEKEKETDKKEKEKDKDKGGFQYPQSPRKKGGKSARKDTPAMPLPMPDPKDPDPHDTLNRSMLRDELTTTADVIDHPRKHTPASALWTPLSALAAVTPTDIQGLPPKLQQQMYAFCVRFVFSWFLSVFRFFLSFWLMLFCVVFRVLSRRGSCVSMAQQIVAKLTGKPFKLIDKESRKTKIPACAHCGKTQAESALKKCGRCGFVVYCSGECQKANWSVHKELCVPRTSS